MNSPFIPDRPVRFADDGYAAWLRYKPLGTPPPIPMRIAVESPDPIIQTAALELKLGLECLFEQPCPLVADDKNAAIRLIQNDTLNLKTDGFQITQANQDILIESPNSRGMIYAIFHLVRLLQTSDKLKFPITEEPAAPIRYLNHWDNLDGTIERGYAGLSIFYDDDQPIESILTPNLERVRDYARLIASIGINGVSINNVNSDDRLYSDAGLPTVIKLANIFAEYGIGFLLSVCLDSPLRQGKLETFDPCNPDVQKFWADKVQQISTSTQNFVGFVLKADSEGRLGPSAYNRTHADAANCLAQALAPINGHIFYRGFVYNHKLDWRDLTLDRAKAQYDNLQPLDGQFASNAIIQIKNGPIDFQVREPVSPTFAALEQTPTVIEFMITQEYLGQQFHTVYEVPWWKDSLEFDFQFDGKPSKTKDIVTGKTFPRQTCGFVAVCGVGRSSNWMGNHLAQANLYGYGRLAWNPDLSANEISDEWCKQTFSRDANTYKTITNLLLSTWPTYEKYTGNLGIGGLTDVIHIHYGPAPLSSEHNGWGQWHRSTESATGMNRTLATGTGFTAQYPPKAAAIFDNLNTCPEELLLFFHNVPYTHQLKSGKSVIQHIYDEHYQGALEAQQLTKTWQTLRGKIDEKRFLEVLCQLQYQAGHSIVWRDSVCHYFHKLSRIPDSHNRVGNELHRYEAEAMHLTNYEVVNIEPWEAASNSQAIRLKQNQSNGSAETTIQTLPCTYNVHTWFFDLSGAPARFTLQINGKTVDQWDALMTLPSTKIDSHTRQRHTTPNITLQEITTVKFIGEGCDQNPAALDMIELEPVTNP